MNKLQCDIILDSSNRETNVKGTKEFPVAIYQDDLSKLAVPYHWHEELELIVVTSGKMELVVELEKHVLKPGEGVFINSGRLHSCEAFQKGNCTLKSFVFHPRFIYGEENSILFQEYFHSLLQETSASTHILKQEPCENILQAYDIFNSASFAYEFLLREKLTSVLLSILQSIGKTEAQGNIKQLKLLTRCKTMLTFIHNNYKNDITLLEIAKSANVSESEALRCFKTVLNTAPVKYVKNYRIEQSALFLRTTNLPIIDIGFNCGFSEMSYFSKSFKEVYGITPSEYRKQM